jgi:signal transduction histidine kinase/CheY-like chemotaxis protein/HPt (histidine-containing phosphotransfer) domain-containing protein
MLDSSAPDSLVQQASLRLAVAALPRSVLVMLAGCAGVVVLAAQSQNFFMATAVGGLGLLSALWRLHMAHSQKRQNFAGQAYDCAWVSKQLDANAVLTGLMWCAATVWVYPQLQTMERACYVAITFGYLGLAAVFMPVVGPAASRPFVILVATQMGAMVGVSLLHEATYSGLLAGVATLYALGLLMGAHSYVRSATRAIAREHELTAANQGATEASQAKSIFLANMSHEIRTPLTAVIGFSEALLDVDQTMAQRIEAAVTIHRAGKHLLDVIDSLLDLSKIEAQRMELECMPVAVLPLLAEIASFSRLQAADKGLALVVEHQFPLPPEIWSDSLRVRQVLLNLIGNAIKFSASGTVTLSASYAAPQARLTLSVSDTGIGISEDQLTRLFQPFGQADSSISRRFGGSGLGLVLSKKLAELLGGTLVVKSSPGQGSCFSLVLPTGPVDSLLSSEPAPQNPLTHARPFEPPQPLQGQVLLAEDNPDNQQLIRRHVLRLGASLKAVENGAMAVEAARDQTFDLILMDMQMPVMDGLTAVRTLRASGYSQPIVALTANATRFDMQACLGAGCDAFLTKPIVRSVFDEVMRRFLLPQTPPAGIGPARALDMAPNELTVLGMKLKQAAEADDAPALQRLAQELRMTASQLGCEPAVRLSGQLEFAATVADFAAAWGLLDRLQQLADHSEPITAAHQGTPELENEHTPMASELLAEGPEMAELVGYFLIRLPDYQARMQAAVSAIDFSQVKQIAHDLKSVGGGYGYPALFQWAQDMEAAAAGQNTAHVAALMQRLDALVVRILASPVPAQPAESTAA